LIEGAPPRWWAAAAAAILIVLTVVWPRVLQPANAAWFRLGRLLHRLVSPIIMAALFYLVVTPVGLVRQLLGRGAAPSLRRNASARSYWTTRSGFSPMNQQF
jgi:hypothetical protein